MRRTILITAFLFFLGISTPAQQPPACPVGHVCITQELANKLFVTVDQLLAAKDLIAKLQAAGSTDATALAQALKVIEGWKEVDAVNGLIIIKYERVIALYEKVVALHEKALDTAFKIIERLETQLNKPKSAWKKFLGGLKRAFDILTGIVIGKLLTGGL